MMEIVITNNMRNKAHKKAKEMGVLYKSITRGKGNVFGFLGEEIARKVLGGEENNTRDYDLIISNKKIDVKTKKTSVTPKSNYECSVADVTRKQDCDYFAFNGFTWVLLDTGNTTSIKEISHNTVDGKIYDLLGRELKYIPTGEMYIMNKKLYISK